MKPTIARRGGTIDRRTARRALVSIDVGGARSQAVADTADKRQLARSPAQFIDRSVVVVDHAHAEGEHQCSGDYDDEEAEAEHGPVESVEDE